MGLTAQAQTGSPLKIEKRSSQKETKGKVSDDERQTNVHDGSYKDTAL